MRWRIQHTKQTDREVKLRWDERVRTEIDIQSTISVQHRLFSEIRSMCYLITTGWHIKTGYENRVESAVWLPVTCNARSLQITSGIIVRDPPARARCQRHVVCVCLTI